MSRPARAPRRVPPAALLLLAALPDRAAAMPGAASSMHSSDAAVNQQGGNVASTQGEFFRYVNAFTSQPSDENREIAQRLADNVRCAL